MVSLQEVYVHQQGPTFGGMIGAAAQGIGAAASTIINETSRAMGDMSISATILV